MCYLWEGGEKGKRWVGGKSAHFWDHYRREWLPFVPPWHLRGSLIAPERGGRQRWAERESPPQGVCGTRCYNYEKSRVKITGRWESRGRFKHTVNALLQSPMKLGGIDTPCMEHWVLTLKQGAQIWAWNPLQPPLSLLSRVSRLSLCEPKTATSSNNKKDPDWSIWPKYRQAFPLLFTRFTVTWTNCDFLIGKL